MKKFTFFVFTLLIFSNVTFAQENPCATVVTPTTITTVNNGNGTCTTFYTFHLQNDVSQNPKGVMIEIITTGVGGGTILSSDCFLASNIPGGISVNTTPFTVLCTTTFTARITRYTASNGQCQGGICSMVILPVTFGSFTAVRNYSNVILKWETVTEQNNKGFEVQRKTTGNDFTTIAFVNTKANGGNSESDLSYSFNDLNTVKGISQYRIQQVDFDGKSKFTEVRTVRGEAQSSNTIVYPNPSSNGTVNVVFEVVNTQRNVTVIDMNGRIIKQWQNVISNTVQIENLTPGFYSLRVVNIETGEQLIEKIIVTKH